MKPTIHRKNHELQTLERRTMLDGNVAATIEKGDLVLRGDSEDNQIVIYQRKGGVIRVASLDETRVNGKAYVDFAPFRDDLTTYMQQGGEDVVSIQGPFTIPDALRARHGEGEMIVEGSAGAVNIGGGMSISTLGEGVATVRNEVRVGGEVLIHSQGEANVFSGQAYIPDFKAARFTDSTNINNPYFPLVPGTAYTYEAEVIDDETEEVSTEDIIVEVLSSTRTIMGVKVREVRDRVYEEDLLIEDTIDWYAQDSKGNVWYFGEKVVNYEYDDEGNLIETNDEGSWKAGEHGAQAGIIMEARPRLGKRYYQEFGPGNVLDQAEGIALNETIKTPVGTFTKVFRTEEITASEPEALANKLYAPGLGTILEYDFDIEDNEVVQTTRLVSVKLNRKAVKQVVSADGFGGSNPKYSRLVHRIEFDDEAQIHATGSIFINGLKADDDVEIMSDDSIVIADSALNEDMAIRTGDTVSLKSVFADEEVKVSGDCDVYIFDSDIDEFEGSFGKRNSEVFVTGSEFDEFELDGGGGKDTFDDLGGNEFDEIELTRFTRA